MVFCMLCLNPLSASAKSKNNVEKIGNSWFYTKNGHISSNYTGFADNKYGTWYCRNGKLDYSATTVADGKNSRWLVQNGKVNYDYTGLCQVNDRLYPEIIISCNCSRALTFHIIRVSEIMMITDIKNYSTETVINSV